MTLAPRAPLDEKREHYCTLFSRDYLPFGLALRTSLERLGRPFTLWILCMDEDTETALRSMALPSVALIPLREVEDRHPALRAARSTRSFGEYCWTCTPYLPHEVFHRAPDIERVTYLDADVFVFCPLDRIFRELETSGADVIVTDHGYLPEDEDPDGGRFCVQLLPFRNSPGAREILEWWQGKCAEWCYARREPGRYGDQKYLDEWPGLFGKRVHVLSDPSLTLAPWNVGHLWKGGVPEGIYHFHGTRIFAGGEAMLYPAGHTIKVPFRGWWRIYVPYERALRQAWQDCRRHGVEFQHPPAPRKPWFLFRRIGRFLLRIQHWSRLDRSPWRSLQGWSPFER